MRYIFQNSAPPTSKLYRSLTAATIVKVRVYNANNINYDYSFKYLSQNKMIESLKTYAPFCPCPLVSSFMVNVIISVICSQ